MHRWRRPTPSRSPGADRAGQRQPPGLAVVRRRPVPAQRFEVLGRGVALVLGPAVARELRRQRRHHGVPLDLGQHAGRRDRRALQVGLDQRAHRRAGRRSLEQGEQPVALRVGQPVVVAVQEHQVGYGGQLGQGAPPRRAQRRHDADRVDLVRAGVPDGLGRRPAADPRHQRARGRCGASSLESRTPWGTVPHRGVDQHDADRHRTGECTAAHLVHRRDPGVALPQQGTLDPQRGLAGEPADRLGRRASRADAVGALTCRRSRPGPCAKVAFGTAEPAGARQRPDDQRRRGRRRGRSAPTRPCPCRRGR